MECVYSTWQQCCFDPSALARDIAIGVLVRVISVLRRCIWRCLLASVHTYALARDNLFAMCMLNSHAALVNSLHRFLARFALEHECFTQWTFQNSQATYDRYTAHARFQLLTQSMWNVKPNLLCRKQRNAALLYHVYVKFGIKKNLNLIAPLERILKLCMNYIYMLLTLYSDSPVQFLLVSKQTIGIKVYPSQHMENFRMSCSSSLKIIWQINAMSHRVWA